MPKASLVKKKWGEKKVGHYVVAISYAISVFIIIIFNNNIEILEVSTMDDENCHSKEN